MTPLEALIKANNSAGIKSFEFCRDLAEFQDVLKKYKFEEYPINICTPLTFNGTTNRDTGIRKAIIPLSGWVLTRIKEQPVNVRTQQIEDLYINPMRKLAAKFIKGLLATDIIDPQVNPVTDRIGSEYNSTNALLFGASYQINLPIKSNVCIDIDTGTNC